MNHLTPFPCQVGSSDSQFSAVWSSQDRTVQLTEDKVLDDLEHIIARIQIAYANTIQAYTGDTSVRFLSSSPDKRSHRIHTLTIEPETTVVDGSREILKSTQCSTDTSPTPTNALIDVSPRLPASFCEPIYAIPFQVLYQLDIDNARIRIRIHYDQVSIDVFHADSVGRYLSNQMKLVLEAYSDACICDFDRLLAEDVAYIKALNAQAQTIDRRTIHGCISETARRSPNEVVVEAWDGILTRQQLEHESEVLAITLIDSGAERGCVVGVIMDKSVWTPVAILAVLKAGAAFLLLEPTLPFERMKIMAQTARTTHAITSRKYLDLACSLVPTVIANDGHGDFVLVDKGDGRESTNTKSQLPKVDPNDQAFLIFTSGSSGVPKAIITQHFAWVTGYTQHIHKFGITQGTRVFQYASYSFVVSILDTISTLLVGGIVCIPGPEERVNDLESAICRLRGEYVCMTPSVAKTIDPARVPSIRTLVLVGEPIPRSLVETWSKTGDVTLRNGYGQSEACSMNSTAVLSNPDAPQRNIGNSTWLRYWIVDPWNHDRLMPVGGLGELLVEGYSVAQGYLDQPDKTATAFIQQPSWASDFGAGEQGRRWYKTGDLVQYQANGDLFLYGRKDAQLKVNGQRVEAAEIEHHILKAFQHEIGQVVVDKTSPVDESDAGRLVAFVTMVEKADSPLSSGASQACCAPETDLRDEVIRRLEADIPMWMIPTAVILVPKMPRTATGKLDRRALKESYKPEPDIVKADKQPAAQPVMQTKTSDEQLEAAEQSSFVVLKQLCSRILKVDEHNLSPQSRWINIGGDSLTAMILVRDARRLGFSFKSLDIMSGTPLIDLCQLRHDQVDALQETQATAIDNNRWYPTTDFQRDYLSRTTILSRELLYKYAFTFRGDFVLQKLREALETWIKNTESLRLTFSYSSNGDLLQRVISSDDKEWGYRIQDNSPKEQQQLGFDSSGWDFHKHPVLILVPTNAAVNSKSIEIGIHIHHGIFDGSSVNHLLHDLVIIYMGNQIPARPSFVTYLSRPTQTADSIGYWKTLLHGSTPTMLRTNPGCTQTTSANPQVNDRTINRTLYLPSNPQKATTASTSTLVQTAWCLVLSALSNRPDVLFLYLHHGRDEQTPQSDQIIGCCVTETPLRVDLSSHNLKPATALTSTIQTQVSHSSAHAHLGSSTIASKCTDWPERDNWYQHSSYVLHQTAPMDEHIPVSDIGYLDVSEPEVEHKLTYDFDLQTTSAGSGELSLELKCPEDAYTAVEAEATVEAFVLALRMLVEEDEGLLEGLRERVRSVPNLPVMGV